MVGDHWTAWDPPPAGPDAYIIVKDDTLWDLAESWLGDPFLWPQIWDENRYILDSHWIYPGDPLVIPGRPTVVPEEGPTTAETTPPVWPPDEEDQPGEAGRPTQRISCPLPRRWCWSRLRPTSTVRATSIPSTSTPSCGSPDRKNRSSCHLGEGDVLYLNQGKNQGIQAGDEFAAVRKTREVKHPATGQQMGSFVQRLGKVRVMLTQENTSTAVIEMSCEDIMIERRAGALGVDSDSASVGACRRSTATT